jgi:hypothetical protein
MNTLETLGAKFNQGSFDHLEDIEIPVLTGMQRQGDVIVIPQREGKIAGLLPIPKEGIAVVRGENGGNTHLLVAEGDVTYAPNPSRGQRLGSLLVGEGGVAYLTHPEHGFNAIGTGSYVINRQREQADEIRIIAD